MEDTHHCQTCPFVLCSMHCHTCSNNICCCSRLFICTRIICQQDSLSQIHTSLPCRLPSPILHASFINAMLTSGTQPTDWPMGPNCSNCTPMSCIHDISLYGPLMRVWPRNNTASWLRNMVFLTRCFGHGISGGHRQPVEVVPARTGIRGRAGSRGQAEGGPTARKRPGEGLVCLLTYAFMLSSQSRQSKKNTLLGAA